MQFLPSAFDSNSDLISLSQAFSATASSNTSSATAFAERASSDGAGFDNVLAQAMADSSAENMQAVQDSMNENGEEGPEVKVESPYTRHTTDGVTYTLEEISFTRQDLQDLRSALEKEGVPTNTLKELDKLIEMPDGATLGQVMLKLRDTRQVELSDQDMDAIAAQCNSVDPSGVLSGAFIQALNANNPHGALKQLGNALAGLDPSEQIEVTKSGVLAMAKALGMDEKGLQELAGSFGDAENATVLAGDFGKLFASAAEQLVAEKANQEKMNAALSKSLKSIVAKARERMQKEQQAHSLQDRKVAQSKAQIDRSVQEKSRDILNNTLNALDEEEETDAVQRNSAVFGKNDGEVSKAQNHASPLRDESQRFATNTELDSDVRQGNDRHGSSDDKGEMQQNGAQSGWQDLLSKVEGPSSKAMSSQAIFAMTDQMTATAENAMLNNNKQPAPLASHLANQVESGMLRTLRNGATSLELQLHPQELGTLNIVLTSLNGEVSAKIIANKGETAEMLTQQLDTIRASLEEQGIKVERVDVEYHQNDQENSDHPSWQDMDQHNSWQEQEARRQTMARIRTLASIRNNTGNSEASILERSVHTQGHTAGNSTSALDLVA